MAGANPAVARARAALVQDDPGTIKTCIARLEGEATADEALEVLGDALACPHWTIRRLAANLIVDAGDVAVPGLARLLGSRNNDQVYWACHALGRLGPAAGPVLAQAVKSQTVEHRNYALHALARRPHADAVATLVLALDDRVWSIRKKAADILMVRPDKDRVVETLKDELRKGNRNRIYWAVRILSRILGERALSILRMLTSSRDDDVRYLAVVALGRITLPESAALLVEYMKDRSVVVRRKAAELVAATGALARDRLVQLVETGQPDAALAALVTLHTVAPDDFLARCASLLRSNDTDAKYRTIAALAEARTQPAIELLIGCFSDPLWVVRRLASDELARIGDPAVASLAKHIRGDDEDTCFWSICTLGRIGRSSLPWLKEALLKGDRLARKFALTALAEAGPPIEVSILVRECFRDEHWPIRNQSAEVLAGMGARVAPILIEPAFGADEDSRFWARKVLVRLFGDDATRFVEGLRTLPDEARRRAVSLASQLPAEEFERIVHLDGEQALRRLETALGADRAPRQGVAVPGTATALPHAEDDPRGYLTGVLGLLAAEGGIEAYLREATPPFVKVDKALVRLSARPPTRAGMDRLLEAIGESRPGSAAPRGGPGVVVGLDLGQIGRCRVRLFSEGRGPTLAIRPLGVTPPRLRDVGDDELLEPLAQLGGGLVLVSGLACSGRTWTAAALVDAVNSQRPLHVATVEAPVEHLHGPAQGLVTQVSVGHDVPTFLDGLRLALACDCSVVMLGEVPDGDTAALALEAAASDTLVIAVLRAFGSVAALRSLVDLACKARRDRALHWLASSFRCSIHQALLPRADGKGRVAVREVLGGVPNVLHPLAQGRFGELVDLLKENPPAGVRSFEQALRDLVRRGIVSHAVANAAQQSRIVFERND